MNERIHRYRRHRNLLIGLLLFLGTMALYWQALSYAYINIDDPEYAAHNFNLKQGLSKTSIAWAFTTTKTANWHPMTWISYLMDVQLLGSSARAHRFVNLLFHALNVVLVNLVLRRMTNATWPSLIVSILFAVHPLNIESVVWISERKNVLSTLFWLLVMWCYANYTESKNFKAYLAALILFALGLMAKPMLVTLPCVLLLLDFWPLGRLSLSPKTFAVKKAGLLIWEKIPFFFFTTASCIVTYMAQKSEGAVQSLDAIPFGLRLANAFAAYILYLKKIIWPQALAIFYPYPPHYPWWQTAGFIILLSAGIYAAIRTRQQHPYILFGLFWYLGTLVPVIGIVQVGEQAMADRYAYVPTIGIFVLVTWGAQALFRQRGIKPAVAATTAGLTLAALATATWAQTQYWQNSKTLLQRAIAVTTDNYVAHNNLGGAYAQKRQFDQAAWHYEEALRAKHDHWRAQNNLGLTMAKMGRYDDALEHYYKALQQNPDYAEAHNNIGSVMAEKGHREEALKHFRRAIQINPRYAAAHNNLATVLAQRGQMQEALSHYAAAVDSDPYFETAIIQLALVQMYQGHTGEAILTLEKGIKRLPQNGELISSLATIHFQQKEYDQALELFLRLTHQFPDHPETYYNVACIYAQQHQTENAVIWLRKALGKGYRNWEKIRTDPDLDPIRHTQAYQQFIRSP